MSSITFKSIVGKAIEMMEIGQPLEDDEAPLLSVSDDSPYSTDDEAMDDHQSVAHGGPLPDDIIPSNDLDSSDAPNPHDQLDSSNAPQGIISSVGYDDNGNLYATHTVSLPEGNVLLNQVKDGTWEVHNKFEYPNVVFPNYETLRSQPNGPHNVRCFDWFARVAIVPRWSIAASASTMDRWLLQLMFHSFFNHSHGFARLFWVRFAQLMTRARVVSLLCFLTTIQVFTGVPIFLAEVAVNLMWSVIFWLGPTKCAIISILTYSYMDREVRLFCFSVTRMLMWDARRYDVTGIWEVIRHAKSEDRPSISHPGDAQLRNNSTIALIRICERFQWKPYFLLYSRRIGELRLNDHPLDGAALLRNTYNYPYDPYVLYNEMKEITNEHAICMVDRDYYLDMTDVLLLARPVLLFTFTPECAAKTSDNISYYFKPNGHVVYHVSGGNKYEHRLWDYGDDIIRVARHSVNVAHKVYRFKVGADRSIIMLLPTVVASTLEEDVPLPLYNPVSGRAVIVRSHEKSYLSLATITQTSDIKMDSDLFDAIVTEAYATAGKTKMPATTVAKVYQYLTAHAKKTGEKELEDIVLQRKIFAVIASMDLETYRMVIKNEFSSRIKFNLDQALKETEWGMEYSAPDTSVTFVAKDSQGLEDTTDNSAQKRFMEPFAEGTAVASRSEESISDCLEKRIIAPQTSASEKLHASKIDIKLVKVFARMLLGGHQLHPYDETEVLDRMSRPSQTADAVDSSYMFPFEDRRPCMFPKAEPLSKNQRPIITKGGPLKWRFAAYVYPMTDILKRQPWYAFGKPPSAVAQRVAQVCQTLMASDTPHVVMTDFSRFDGHVNPYARAVVGYIYEEAYSHDAKYSADIKELLQACYCQTTDVTSFNDLQPIMKREKGYEQASGDQNTSNLGTIVNAFISFCALMEYYDDAERAWHQLGIYGGDDGLVAHPQPHYLVEAATNMGFKLEEAVAVPFPSKPDGSDYVKFLARIYTPDVFYGEVNSMCDIRRTLGKFHLTDNYTLFPAAMKLWQKAYSAQINDSNTPIIGDYVNAVCSAYSKYDESAGVKLDTGLPTQFDGVEDFYAKCKAREIISHWGAIALAFENGFPNDNSDGWMWDYVEKAIPEFDPSTFDLYLENAKEASAEMLPKVDKSSRRQSQQSLARVLAPFAHPPLIFHAETKIPVDRPVLVTQNGETEIRNPEAAITPKISDLPPPPGFDNTPVQVLNYIRSNGIPYEKLTQGSRKCLYVISHFIQQASRMKTRGCHIVYSGAEGENIMIAAELLLKHLVPFKLYLFDPRLSHKEELLALGKKYPEFGEKPIMWRQIPFDVESAKYVADHSIFKTRNGKTKQAPILWLDDMYAEGSSSDMDYNALKLEIMKVLKPQFVSLKVKPMTDLGYGLTYYHTPEDGNVHFSSVNELRAYGTPDPDAPGSAPDTPNYSTIGVTPALMLLHQYALSQ